MAEQSDRKPLNRAIVLRAAVDLADAEGIDALSMRRLAEVLGVVPMALYKHVADKDDLLSGMVDVVIGEFEPVAPGAWRDGVRRIIASARAAVSGHPWARQAIETLTMRTAAVLSHMEVLTSLLLAGGLSPDLTHHAMHALGNRIWGFSPELFNDPGRPAAATAPAPDPTSYPGILAVARDATARRPGATGCDEEFEFFFALDLILDGIERLQASGWTSAGPQRGNGRPPA